MQSRNHAITCHHASEQLRGNHQYPSTTHHPLPICLGCVGVGGFQTSYKSTMGDREALLRFVSAGLDEANIIRLALACLNDTACKYFSGTGWLQSSNMTFGQWVSLDPNAHCLYTRQDVFDVGRCKVFECPSMYTGVWGLGQKGEGGGAWLGFIDVPNLVCLPELLVPCVSAPPPKPLFMGSTQTSSRPKNKRQESQKFPDI